MSATTRALYSSCCFAFVMVLASRAPAQQDTSSDVIAIEVMLLPDATLIKNAEEVNKRLRENFTKGYALDGAHAPRVTLVQGFVRVSDLDAVSTALTTAVQSGRPTLPITLTAIGLASNVRDEMGVVAYAVERSPELLRLAGKIEDAVRPFAISIASAEASAKASSKQIDVSTVKYVEAFLPASSGEKYSPRVTVGTAYPDFVIALKAEPFRRFTFSGVNIAISQLGSFGTAQKQLWVWKPQ